MSRPCRWEMLLLITVWSGGHVVPGTYCQDAAVSHLSRDDVLLLKDEQDPKCLTRTGQDFTCFFEAADNRTYDFLYKFHSLSPWTRCNVSVQETEDDTVLHICSFPPADVLLFVETHVEVVERNSSTRLYSRTVSVEDNFLLDPVLNVSLQRTGRAGQLLVGWRAETVSYCKDVMHRIRWSDEGQGTEEDKTILSQVNQEDYNTFLLDSLEPGGQTEVLVSVKCASSHSEGHWSSWSQPARAFVPQSADDVSLVCLTADLQNVSCQWNGSRFGLENYKLSYSLMDDSDQWSECPMDGFTDLCRFHGDESKRVRVRLSGAAAPLGRTFYTAFAVNSIIRTCPPDQLRAAVDHHRLCLDWDAPVLALSAHLQYEVGYRSRAAEAWTRVSVKGPEPGTCLEVPAGTRYQVKVRAKPDGSQYSGLWSDWSQVLTGQTPTDAGLWLMLVVPVSTLVTATFLISTYLRKLKLYFWPPLPNLDKVLKDFLTEMDQQRWDPPLTLKPWSEETTESVLEIISGPEGPEGTEGTEGTEGPPSGGDQVPGAAAAEVFPDYVDLEAELLQTGGGSVHVPQSSAKDFLNYSYEPLAVDTLDRGVRLPREPGNIYTNLPCS